MISTRISNVIPHLRNMLNDYHHSEAIVFMFISIENKLSPLQPAAFNHMKGYAVK